MQHTHVIHGCSYHSRGVKMGSPMGNIIGILFNIYMDVCGMCIWLTKKEMENFIEKII